MQTLALENYGTVEMNLDEQKETDGGSNPFITWSAIAEAGKAAIRAVGNAIESAANSLGSNGSAAGEIAL